MTNRDKRIEAALAALDKATPGPWFYDCGYFYSKVQLNDRQTTDESPLAEMLDGRPENYDANIALIAVAPDMAEKIKEQEADNIRLRKWQSEAMGWLGEAKCQCVVERREGDAEKIDRLIAEAEGEK